MRKERETIVVILGLNAFNRDAAAVLVTDGKVAAAVEEERLTRVKHAGGFPTAAIRACLEIAGLGIEDVDHIAFARRPERNMEGPILYALAGRSSYAPALRSALEEAAQPFDWRSLVARGLDVDEARLKFQVHAVEHQLAHAASAFYSWPLERAAVLTVDTVGDFATTLLARGSSAGIEVLGRVLFPHSLGLFYGMVSQLIGFEAVGDESRTMGLAALGSDALLAPMRRVLRPTRNGGLGFELDLDYFRHNSDGEPVRPVEGAPRFPPLYSAKALAAFGPPRHPEQPLGPRERDLAFAVQRVLEERLVELASRLAALSGEKDLVYAGQVAMNCAANRALRSAGAFRSVSVAPVPHDAGTALGAALEVAVELGERPRRGAGSRGRTDLGPSFETPRARAALEARGIRFHESEDVVGETASALAAGEVVGWFQGRMEFGARALGQRSVLADPRQPLVGERLRRTLSHREAYRSFGASATLEGAAGFFEDAAPSPFMLDAFVARPGAAARIPAVVHVDGTTRLHAFARDENPLFHGLVTAFGERTGVPLLLNTSFNADEPIVCTPEEALACALRAGLDRIVIGSLVADLPRRASPEGEPAFGADVPVEPRAVHGHLDHASVV